MERQYVGEQLPDSPRWCAPNVVKYLKAAEREQYKLTVRDGLLFDAAGEPFDTSEAKTLFSAYGWAVFVMDTNGAIFAFARPAPGRFHHSSFLAGAPVAAAGEISVEEGALKAISNGSGHYRPGWEFVEQALEVLAQQGVDMRGVEKHPR